MIFGNIQFLIMNGHGFLEIIQLIKMEYMEYKEYHLQIIFLDLEDDSISWIDSLNNNLWLFGGGGFDSVGDHGN